MSVFDQHIDEIKTSIEGLCLKNSFVNYQCSGTAEEIIESLPFKVGKNANERIILRSDTFLELGSPIHGSCSLFLWTENTSKIVDGKITLIGPDIPDSEGDSLPLGQIFLVGGKKFPELEHNMLTHNSRVSNDIEGFMLKSSTKYESWGRVSKDAASKGFSFEILGKAMMAHYKSKVPETEAIEIIFITTSKEDVKQLDTIASKASEISREIVKEAWKAKGYDLDCDYDCSSCGDSNVCEPIREVVKERSSRKERKYVTRKSDAQEKETVAS